MSKVLRENPYVLVEVPCKLRYYLEKHKFRNLNDFFSEEKKEKCRHIVCLKLTQLREQILCLCEIVGSTTCPIDFFGKATYEQEIKMIKLVIEYEKLIAITRS
jgi:hypothetical protein